MAYEWDGRRARRSYLYTVAGVLLATVVTIGLPIYIVAEAISR